MSRRGHSLRPVDYAQRPEAWPDTRLSAFDLAPYFAREFSRELGQALVDRSARSVAVEAGVARSALYNYLDGLRWPSLDAIGALSTTLGVDLLPTRSRQYELWAELAAELALDPLFERGSTLMSKSGRADFMIGGVEYEVKVRNHKGRPTQVRVSPLTVSKPTILVEFTNDPDAGVVITHLT